MKKITASAIAAFNSQSNFKSGNTQVIHTDGVTKLLLFNNIIATSDGVTLSINSCGWKTATTKERLNGLTGISIRQERGNWFLNGEPWDGSKIILPLFYYHTCPPMTN